MGKTAGSRKKATKSIVADNPHIETEGALEEVKGLLNRSPEDAPPSKRAKKTSSKASLKASSKKIVIVVEEEEEDKVIVAGKDEDKVVVVQDDAPTKSSPTISESEPLAEVKDVEMTTEDSKQEQEVVAAFAPLSPKSTLLAFRRDPALQTQSMQDREPAAAAHKVATPAAAVTVAEPLPATKVASIAAHTDVPESLPHPIARDTIEYYKQSMAAMSKENESLKSLLGQVQGCLKQSEDGFVKYKQLHELKVSELTKSVEMLTAERTSFTIALQAEESQDGESGGVSLAHYRSLVAQMEAMKQMAIDRESELHTTKQTLSLFQKQCSELNERLETLSLKTEEVKVERDGALGTVEQLTAQLAEQTTLVSEKTADANKFKEAFEKARTENSRLQTIAVQTQSQLAAIEAKKTSLEAQEKLASELKSEIIYTATLEKMLDVIKKLTGLSPQNVETITRQDMNSMETHEYTQFTIKQKGNTQSLSYLLCVPTDKKQNMIYVPSNKGGQNVPAWLADEMEFENHMIRLFFCNVLAFCNNEERGSGEDDLVGMMPFIKINADREGSLVSLYLACLLSKHMWSLSIQLFNNKTSSKKQKMNSSLIGIYNLRVNKEEEEEESNQQATAFGTLRLFKQVNGRDQRSESTSLMMDDHDPLALGLGKTGGKNGRETVDVELEEGDADVLKKRKDKLASKSNSDYTASVGKGGDLFYEDVLLYSNNVPSRTQTQVHAQDGDKQKSSKGRDTILLLSIPSYQTPQDFLLLMGGVYRKDLLHVRLLFEEDGQQSQSTKDTKTVNPQKSNKRSKSTRFMMLFKFKSIIVADSFYSEFNGKLFTSFENDICHLVWIDMIILMIEQDRNHQFVDGRVGDGSERKETLQLLFPSAASAPPSIPSSPTTRAIKNEVQDFGCIEELVLVAAAEQQDSKSPREQPTLQTTMHPSSLSKSTWVEMPTCPVCLDRLDSSVTGLFTSLCNHTFHCSCIIKWDDTTCPVCRFHSFGASMDMQTTRNPVTQDGNVDGRGEGNEYGVTQDGNVDGRGEGNEYGDAETVCMVCSISDNLWICLICAHVGCGRYQKGHARTHFEETGHVYSLELVTQRVWDYKGDGYVHRIIQNTDGKLVHLPPPTSSQTPTRNVGGNRGDLSLAHSQPRQQAHHGQLFNDRQPGLDVKSPNPIYTPADVTVAHKLETVNQEYQELISSTLLEQKSYHQSQLESLELKSIDRFVHLEGIIGVVQAENDVLKSECRRLTNALEASVKNAEKVQAKYERSCKKVESSMQSLEEEREVSTRLLQNYQQLQAAHAQVQDVTVKNLQSQVSELQEQVRDLMFFLETREKVSRGELGGGEISGASVVGVVAASPPTAAARSPSTPGRKGKKKR